MKWSFKRLLAALNQGGREFAPDVVKASGWEWGTVYAWLEPGICPPFLEAERACWHRDNYAFELICRPSILVDGRF
jgi:hypothetical protein